MLTFELISFLRAGEDWNPALWMPRLRGRWSRQVGPEYMYITRTSRYVCTYTHARIESSLRRCGEARGNRVRCTFTKQAPSPQTSSWKRYKQGLPNTWADASTTNSSRPAREFSSILMIATAGRCLSYWWSNYELSPISWSLQFALLPFRTLMQPHLGI
jgi:hypothetical protein